MMIDVVSKLSGAGRHRKAKQRPMLVDKQKMRRRDIRITAVWDIEAHDWTEFVVGGVLDENGVYRDYLWPDMAQMARDLAATEGTLWAHFAGGYDLKWLIDLLGDLGIETEAAELNDEDYYADGRIINAGSRIVSFQVGKALFCDSYALAPMTLAKLTRGMSVSKEELGLPCRHLVTCAKDCQGYCAIDRGMPPEMLKRLRRYLRADCVSLHAALHGLRAYAKENDLDLGRTCGSSAWRHMRRVHSIPAADDKMTRLAISDRELRRRYLYAKLAYYGGRTQLYRRGVIARGREYDVNSMYAWAMLTTPLPVGRPARRYGAEAQAAFARGAAGVYRARVIVPEDMFLPPLPYRYSRFYRLGEPPVTKSRTAEDADRAGSIAYPTGAFTGTWAYPELKHAADLGVKVEVIDALVWRRTETLLKPWVDHVWGLRKNAPGGKKSPIGEWLKLYLNSPTGKFGSSPEHLSWFWKPTKMENCECRCAECSKERRVCACPEGPVIEKCRCPALTQASETLWYQPHWFIDTCSHIVWAAYITGRARVKLHEQQLRCGPGGRAVAYSDTDSIHVDVDDDPAARAAGWAVDPAVVQGIGADVGLWEDTGPWLGFRGIAPKVYSYSCLPPHCSLCSDTVKASEWEDHLEAKHSASSLSFSAALTSIPSDGLHVKAAEKEKRDALPFLVICSRHKQKDGSACGGGRIVARAKGITLPHGTDGQVEAPPMVGLPYPKEGIIGYRAGVTAGRLFLKRENFSRRLSERTGDRVVLADGVHTRAPRIEELKP